MDIERLPSGKFETNELVMELTILAYNMLRMIGQESIRSGKAPKPKHEVHRRRLRTVINNLILIAGHLTKHARRLTLSLGRSNVWRNAFRAVVQGCLCALCCSINLWEFVNVISRIQVEDNKNRKVFSEGFPVFSCQYEAFMLEPSLLLAYGKHKITDAFHPAKVNRKIAQRGCGRNPGLDLSQEAKYVHS